MERPIRIPAEISLGFGEIYGDDIRGAGWDYSGKRHQGIDYAVPEGTEVYAAEAGAVDFAGFDRTGYGNLVKIGHAGGIGSKYAHLSKILVKRWQRVAKGELIGLSGSTGTVTGAHLHFEATENGKAVDPNLFFEAAVESATMVAAASQGMADDVNIEGSGQARIVVDLANIRAAPGGAELLGQLRWGTKLTVGKERVQARGLSWRKATAVFWIAESDASGVQIIAMDG